MPRFEAATLAGIGVGIVAAGPLWDGIARGAFVLNAGIYAASFAIYRWGVADVAGVRHADEHAAVAAVHGEPFNLSRYMGVLRSPGVWLLAPTWVALNAVLGSWTTQPVFQLVKDPTSEFAGQLLMGGFAPTQVSVGMAAALVVFFAGLFYWGNRFRSYRRTTIIIVGIAGGLAMMTAIFCHQPLAALRVPSRCRWCCSCSAASSSSPVPPRPRSAPSPTSASRTPPIAARSWASTRSSWRIGQIVGALASGWAADWRGIDGLLAASLLLLLVAILPLHGLRRSEHLVGAAHAAGATDPAPG